MRLLLFMKRVVLLCVVWGLCAHCWWSYRRKRPLLYKAVQCVYLYVTFTLHKLSTLAHVCMLLLAAQPLSGLFAFSLHAIRL